jgi:cell division protein FtsI (penicillin-binding protein 3)
LAILVLIEEPKKKIYGGLAAAPVFKSIAESALARTGISSPAKGNPVIALAESLKTAEKKGTEAGGRTEANPGVMPDLTRMGMREALITLKEVPLPLKVEGQGRVTGQNPSPGRPWKEAREIRLTFGWKED